MSSPKYGGAAPAVAFFVPVGPLLLLDTFFVKTFLFRADCEGYIVSVEGIFLKKDVKGHFKAWKCRKIEPVAF